jgi:hypothetical protein
MRGFFIDLHSSKEKTQQEQKIYLDLTSPDEPMHPRPEFSFTGISQEKTGIVRRKGKHSNANPPLCTGRNRPNLIHLIHSATKMILSFEGFNKKLSLGTENGKFLHTYKSLQKY